MHARARALAAEHGLHLYATLLSNGVMLPRALVDTLRRERIRVMISLDGVGDDHDALRPTVAGRPTFRLVERTIDQLIEQQHAPHLSITITGRNSAGVADAVRFALARDLTFSLNFFRDTDLAAGVPELRYEEQAMISGLLNAFAVIEGFLPRVERAGLGSGSGAVAAAAAAVLRRRPGLPGHRPAWPGGQVPYGDRADAGRHLQR